MWLECIVQVIGMNKRSLRYNIYFVLGVVYVILYIIYYVGCTVRYAIICVFFSSACYYRTIFYGNTIVPVVLIHKMITSKKYIVMSQILGQNATTQNILVQVRGRHYFMMFVRGTDVANNWTQCKDTTGSRNCDEVADRHDYILVVSTYYLYRSIRSYKDKIILIVQVYCVYFCVFGR